MSADHPAHEVGLVPVLEIGGTHVSAALVELPGCRVLPGSVRRRGQRSEGSAAEVVAAVVGTGDLLDAAPVAVRGVAVPGPFDEAGGVGWFEGVGKLEALRGFDLGAARRSGLSARPSRVSFVNDAVAFGLGEWRAGAARGHRQVVCLTLGTGVGSAFLADGRPVVRGPLVPPDGHAYRLTCDGAPSEDTVSRPAPGRPPRGPWSTGPCTPWGPPWRRGSTVSGRARWWWAAPSPGRGTCWPPR